MFRLLSVPVLLSLAACASSTPATSSDDARFAPRMFTADDLRAALPSGTSLRYRFEEPNKPVVLERWTFVVTTSSIATIETERSGEDGASLGPKERGTSTWVQLMEHGNFPVEKTTIEEVELEATVGKKKCRLYKVQGDGATVRHMYFAYDLAGPPIRFETYKDGERIFRGELLERTAP